VPAGWGRCHSGRSDPPVGRVPDGRAKGAGRLDVLAEAVRVDGVGDAFDHDVGFGPVGEDGVDAAGDDRLVTLPLL